MKLVYQVKPGKLTHAMAALRLLGCHRSTRPVRVKTEEGSPEKRRTYVELVVADFNPAQFAQRCPDWKAVLGLYGWCHEDGAAGGPAAGPYPVDDDATRGRLLRLFEGLMRGSGKGRGVQIEHANSYGAGDGWEVTVFDGAAHSRVTTGSEVKAAVDSDEWPPLAAVLRVALANEGVNLNGD